MSKLSQKIARAGRFESAPMGFGMAVNRKSEPTMLLGVRLPASESNRLKELAGKGVDLALLDNAKPGQKLAGTGELVAGAFITEGDSETAAAFREAGIDFLAVDPAAVSAAIIDDEQLGFVLPVPPDASDTDLRILETLPLDALLVAAPAGAFTLQQYLALRRIAMLVQKPLLVEIHGQINGSQLKSLREAGVAGVLLVDNATDQAVAALRQAIDSLPSRRRRRTEHADALLPRLGQPPALEESEEPEDRRL